MFNRSSAIGWALRLLKVTAWAPWVCGTRGYAGQWGRAAGLAPCLSGAVGWAPQLPRYSGQAPWIVRNGGYTQQLSRAVNYLPACWGLHSRLQPIDWDLNQAELPTELPGQIGLPARLCTQAVSGWAFCPCAAAVRNAVHTVWSQCSGAPSLLTSLSGPGGFFSLTLGSEIFTVALVYGDLLVGLLVRGTEARNKLCCHFCVVTEITLWS